MPTRATQVGGQVGGVVGAVAGDGHRAGLLQHPALGGDQASGQDDGDDHHADGPALAVHGADASEPA